MLVTEFHNRFRANSQSLLNLLEYSHNSVGSVCVHNGHVVHSSHQFPGWWRKRKSPKLEKFTQFWHYDFNEYVM